MRFAKILATLTLLSATLFVLAAAGNQSSAPAQGLSFPRYDHIFVIVEENHSFDSIIGDPYAPTFNYLAQTYGLATSYYGTVHPSEGNYVSIVGGNSYGIRDDNPYYTHTIHKSNLVDQLEGAGLSWKGYFQSMPHAGYKGICYPADCTGPLYASKHNGFLNFADIQHNPQRLQKLVPVTQLTTDLQSGNVPNFSFIAPDQCHDMHGAAPFCAYPGRPHSHYDNILVEKADTYANYLMNRILSSSVWSKGNNALVIVWDEGTTNAGCCDANNGGGRVPTIVVTNNGPRGVQDNTPYNHYSLTATIEQAFGLGCLQFTCDTKEVKPMTPLFATK